MAEFVHNWEVPNLRVSESDKYERDKEWFKQCMNWIKPYGNMGTIQIKDFPQKLSNYRLLNSDIRWEDVQEHCNPLGLTKELFEENMLPFNIVPKIVNELIGEELKRYDDYRPILATQNAIMSKNKEYADLVDTYIDTEISKMMELEKMRSQMMSQGKDEKQVEAELQKKAEEYEMDYKLDSKILDFQSQREILASNIIDYGSYDNNLKALKSQCWKDALTVDEEIVYVGVEKNKPVIKHVNPLFFIYHKSTEEMYIHKGDWAGTTTPMVYADIINQFGTVLSEDDLKNLQMKHTTKDMSMSSPDIRAYHHSNYPNVDDVFFGTLNNYLYGDYNIGTYGNGNSILRFYHNFVWVTHIEWKAFKKVGYLSYLNEYGEEITELVDSEFIVPKNAVKSKIINRFNDETDLYVWQEFEQEFSLEWIWIERVYEGTRIGMDIYVNLREKPFQTMNIEDPYSTCNLGYVGRCYSANNTKSISLVDRMKPFNTLYIIALNHLVNMIARNKGVLVNVDTSQTDLALSASKDPVEAMEIRLKYMDVGLNLYNSVKDADGNAYNNGARPAPTIDDADSTPAILNVLRLLEWLNAETAMIIGVSPQRMAQMVSDRVSDNQQALIQSSYITEPYFFFHNETWKEVNLEYLRIFIIWMKEWFHNNPNKKEYFLNYNFSNAALSTVKLTPDTLDETDYGIRMMLAGNTKEYYDTMKNLALTFVQNGEMTLIDMSDILLSSIGGTSPHSIHNKMEEALDKRDKLRQQEQEAQMKAQAEQQQLALEHEKHLEDRQDKRDAQIHLNKMDELKQQGINAKEVALIKDYQYQEDLDVDDNNIPDPIEAEKLMHQTNMDRAKLGMEQSKLGMEREKLDLAKKSEENEIIKHNDNLKEKEKDRQVKRQTTKKKST